MRATCPIHFILLYFNVIIIFDEYTNYEPPHCKILLCSPGTSYLLGPNILHTSLFSNAFIPYERPSSTPT